jgi:hypothetical protein
LPIPFEFLGPSLSDALSLLDLVVSRKLAGLLYRVAANNF